MRRSSGDDDDDDGGNDAVLIYISAGGFVAACGPVARDGHVHTRFDFSGTPPTEVEFIEDFERAVAVTTIAEG